MPLGLPSPTVRGWRPQTVATSAESAARELVISGRVTLTGSFGGQRPKCRRSRNWIRQLDATMRRWRRATEVIEALPWRLRVRAESRRVTLSEAHERGYDGVS